MDEIMLWFTENWGVLLTTGGIGAVISAISLYITKKVWPQLLNMFIRKLMVVVANMFGSTIDGTAPVVGQLPIVDEFKNKVLTWGNNATQLTEDAREAAEVDYALRLLELRGKIASPLFTAVEKIPFQAAYNLIYNKVKDKLPQEVKDALAVYDSIKVS